MDKEESSLLIMRNIIDSLPEEEQSEIADMVSDMTDIVETTKRLGILALTIVSLTYAIQEKPNLNDKFIH